MNSFLFVLKLAIAGLTSEYSVKENSRETSYFTSRNQTIKISEELYKMVWTVQIDRLLSQLYGLSVASGVLVEIAEF